MLEKDGLVDRIHSCDIDNRKKLVYYCMHCIMSACEKGKYDSWDDVYKNINNIAITEVKDISICALVMLVLTCDWFDPGIMRKEIALLLCNV